MLLDTHSLSLSDSLAAEAVNHASGSAYRADTPISSPAFHLFIYFPPYWNYLHARRAGASARAGHGGVRITFKQGHSTLCVRARAYACVVQRTST